MLSMAKMPNLPLAAYEHPQGAKPAKYSKMDVTFVSSIKSGGFKSRWTIDLNHTIKIYGFASGT